jgi:hypothetical protein
MNQDRELLELAAKAAGIPTRVVDAAPGSYALYPETDGVPEFCCMMHWNPLTDDGDALRLAVKLKLTIEIVNDWVFVRSAITFSEHCPENPRKAVRRAIVRAAAEIGRTMS